MDWYDKTLRACLWILISAVVLRLGTSGFFNPIIGFLTQEEVIGAIWFLETGRRFPTVDPSTPTEKPTAPTQPPDTNPPTAPTEQSLPEGTNPASFWDAGLVQINSYCGYEPQVEAWMEQPLEWELRQETPTVLIVHSHATESYGESPYRTEDRHSNMVSIGDALVQQLEQAGIHVLHDRQLHDSASYSDAYGNSRASVQNYLAKYPDIRLVLDLHRDAIADAEGEQMKTTVPGKNIAQLMLVVGSDAGGLSHNRWPENMSLAVKLHAALEYLCPGICRPISFRTQRFNQDLSPGALLVEVGTAANTRQEALKAAEFLGTAIIGMASGSGDKK